MLSSARTVVAGVASPDDPALPAALRLAARLDDALHVVHVRAAGGLPDAATAAARLRAAMDMAVPGASADPRIHLRVVSGDPEARLLEAAHVRGAELLVLGATRRGRLAGALLGTTAGHLLRQSPVPLLVVRGPLPRRPLRVLLTTDLSHHAVHAHARGGALARLLSAPHVPEMRSLFVDDARMGDDPLAPARPAGEGERELRAFLAETPPTTAVPRVRAGDPAVEILREALDWEADVIVVGTHARAGVPRILLGSVAESVVRQAPCACLVVPPQRDGSPGREPRLEPVF
jgi:nucleotide-binding universal stress UspA family protein